LSQLRKNILSGSVAHGLNILIAFVSYPLYIKFLGLEAFSVWVLLSIVVSFAQMGDFGIGKSVINFISGSLKDKDKINLIVTNSLILVSLISIFIQIFIWVFNHEIISVLNIPSKYINESKTTIIIIGFSIFTFLIFDILSSIISALGRIDISNMIFLSLNFFKLILTVVILSFSPTLIAMAWVVFIGNAIFCAGMFLYLKKNKTLHQLEFSSVNINVMKNTLSFGVPIFGVQVVNILMFPIIKILASQFFGIIYVGFFELATKAAYSFRMIFEKGLMALFPEFSKFSNLFYTDINARTELKNLVLKSTKKLALFGVPFFFILSLFAEVLLKFWLGESFSDEILYGYWSLQPGIIVGLLALPSYYALIGIKKQMIGFYESLIRLILSILLIQFIPFLKLDFYSFFLLISVAVVISNLYVIHYFFKKA
jgi:O-antigen/teichoic acid export membrane protein